MRTLLLSSLVLLPVLALAQADASSKDAAASTQDAAAKLDALYAKRADPAAVKEHDAALAEAMKANPDDSGLLWRAARMKYWMADGLPNGDAKKRLGKEGWELAERALKKNPKSVEANYFSALSIGAYSEAVGVLTALTEGLEGKFNDRLDFAIKADPGMDHGGPLCAKGRYYHELPWPKRDLDKSTQFLQKAAQSHPEGLRTYVYLAETLLDDGKAADAKATLAKALNGSTAYDPAEGLRAKEMARKLQAEKKELR